MTPLGSVFLLIIYLITAIKKEAKENTKSLSISVETQPTLLL